MGISRSMEVSSGFAEILLSVRKLQKAGREFFMNPNRKVLIHYLYHSGFTVEYGDYFLVFDYYRQFSAAPDIRHEIASHKRPLVFVSHSHPDHYNPVIFEWKDENSGLRYVLSGETRRKVGEDREQCIFMNPCESTEVGGVTISTYGSTDLGVSFLVEVSGLRIFHAGDLNWWYWAEESTAEELRVEEESFKKEVARLEGKKMDILFFPVDPRLGEYYWLGGSYMMEKFHPGLFVPMHFADHPGITRRFAEKMKGTGGRIAEITHPGQTFEYRIP